MSYGSNDSISSPIRQRHVFLGASVLILVTTLQHIVQVNGEWQIDLNKLLVFGFNYLVWAFSIPLLFKIIARFDLQRLSKTDILKLLLTVLIVSLVQLLISNLLYYVVLLGFFDTEVNNPLAHFLDFFPQAYLSRIVDLIVIFLLLKGMDNYKTLNQQKVAYAQLEQQLTQSRLETLKMQLNPHFLFNALHAIHALIGYDNSKSKSMLINLSNLLRKVLELGEQQMISLEEELSFFESYLAIEEERFHDRLTVTYNIDSESRSCLIPSLLLQPLLENALKHGISLIDGKGKIELNTNLNNERLSIALTNSHNPRRKAPFSTGIGLKNIESRLKTLFPNAYEFKAEATSDLFTVELSFPKHDV